MRPVASLFLALFLSVALCACEKPTQDECDSACARVKALSKADYDKKTAGLPEDVVRQGWLQSAPMLEEVMASCASACMDVGDRQITKCLKEAADAAAWSACLEKK